MKQKILALASLFLIVAFSSSCIFIGPSIKGNGKVVEEKRKAGKFDEIKVSRGMNVYISQGDETKIVVKADENLLDLIETEVEGRVLKVTTNQNIRRATSKKVFITVPKLESIRSAAGSNVFSETVIECENMEVHSSAGSNIKLELTAKDLNVSASAGSNIKLEGTAKSFIVKASAGANIKAEGLKTNDCEVRVSSGSNIWITVKGDFEAHASSGGNIFYYGNPDHLNVENSSGGNIIKK